MHGESAAATRAVRAIRVSGLVIRVGGPRTPRGGICQSAARQNHPNVGFFNSACLDLCLFAWTDRHRFVRHLRASRGGTHLGLPGVTYLQARRATVSAPGTVWVQTDGELLGELPMTFECLPAALSVIVRG
jgi:diacylglycerol kinase family enzyme